MYENLNFEREGRWALIYPILYQLRILLMIFLSLGMTNLYVQMMLFILSTIGICAVLGSVHAFTILPENYLSLGREAMILLVLDLFLVVSDPSLSVSVQS